MTRVAKLILGFLTLVAVNAIDVKDVPVCAQNCLANSTSAQSSCQVIDIACLCQNTAYVSALSCCLSTQCNSQEQAIAIQFNQQECSKVGESAPDFVGCSPFNGTAATTNVVPQKTSTTLSTSVSSNPLLSTITDPAVSEPATLKGTVTTASFAGKPLLTGSCTVPYFAQITDLQQNAFVFPAIGCAPDRQGCCPFNYGDNAIITQCPQDYFTTAGGCCPVGYQVYYTQFGAYTPCYSVPSTTLVPASTPTGGNVVVVTERVFAQKFTLTKQKSGGLSDGARNGIIGGTVNAGLVVILIFVIIWYRRRRARRILEANRATTFPPVEPTMAMSEHNVVVSTPVTPHELPSPDHTSHFGARDMGWPAGAQPPSSPPGYASDTKSITNIPIAPQELPGSTFIHEHHPAFSSHEPSEAASARATSPPMTPTSRARKSEDGSSAAITPLPSPPIQTGTRSPIISPLPSPRIFLPGRPHYASSVPFDLA